MGVRRALGRTPALHMRFTRSALHDGRLTTTRVQLQIYSWHFLFYLSRRDSLLSWKQLPAHMTSTA